MASVAFRIAGIEPKHDPDWGRAPAAMRRDFWRAVVKLGLQAKDRELAAGKDRHGAAMVPIAASTRANRRSAMGHADPNAPPLTPAYGLSRTRSLLDGRAHADHALFFWRYDPHTQGHWGKILGYHRAGKGRLPVRDVIGLSPASLAWVKAQSWRAWAQLKAGVSATVATKELSVRVVPPPRTPKQAPAKIAVVGRTDFENFTFGIGGSEEQARAALARGQATGFRQFRAPASPPPPAQPRPVAPRPAPAPAIPTAAKPVPRPMVAKPLPPLTPRVASFRPKPPPTPPVVPPKPKPKPKPPTPAPAPAPPPPPVAKPLPPLPPGVDVDLFRRAVEFATRLGVDVKADGHSLIEDYYGAERAKGVHAVYESVGQTIYLNQHSDYWKDPKAVMRDLGAKGYLSSAAEDHVIVHEVGHALHHRAVGDDNYQKVRAAALTLDQIRVVAREVSMYASSKPVEMVAEVFAGLKAGKTYSPVVMDLYDKLKGPRP